MIKLFRNAKLRQLYFSSLKSLRRDVALLDQIRRDDVLTVLNFHKVSPHFNPFWSPLHPDIFDDLLFFLKNNFQVVLFSEIEHVKGGKPIAVLSFDDGYHDFIEYAMPILRKHELSANMNIIPACVESGEPVWLTKLYDFLKVAPKSLINEIVLEGFDHILKDDTNENKLLYSLRISGFLKNRSHSDREAYWGSIEKVLNKIDFKTTRMLDQNDIQEIARTNEIGAHSFSHESMEFEDNHFFREDLRKCIDYFKDKLHIPLDIYAFPNGSYRAEHLDILHNHKIKYKLLVEEKHTPRGSEIISRFGIYGVSRLEVRFQALGINNSSKNGLMNKIKAAARLILV